MKHFSDKRRLARQAGLALLCGAGLMHLVVFLSAWKYGTDRSGPEKVHYPAREHAAAGDEASAQAVALLHRLAREPYMELSDEEVALIAEHLDLTREGSWRLLNGVASPELCTQLWEECVRVNARSWKHGTFEDLHELIEIAGHGALRTDERIYFGIYEEIQRRGSVEHDLMAKGEDPMLLKGYLRHLVSGEVRLEDALKLLPLTAPEAYRGELVDAWAMWHTSGADSLRQVLAGMAPADTATPGALSGADLRAVKEVMRGWKNLTPEDRQDLLGSIATGMSERQRNWVLAYLLQVGVPEGASDMAIPLLAAMTSSAMQKEALDSWLHYDDDGGEARALAAAVAAAPDERGSLKRVSAMLAERAAGKAAPEGEGEK